MEHDHPTGRGAPDPPASATPGGGSAPPEVPAWFMGAVTRATWRIIGIALLVALGLWALNQAMDLVVVFLAACFLALAIVPAVDGIVRRLHWSRGVATLAVILAVVISIGALIGFLVPAMVDVANKFGAALPQWLNDLEQLSLVKRLGIDIPDLTTADSNLLTAVEDWFKRDGGTHVLGLAGSGLGVVAKLFLTLVFTIMIAAGEPAILRAILRVLSPANQARFFDAWNTAIQQTGGYFYSRLLLMLFTSTSTFIVMVLLGMPVLFALPLAVFGAFFVEFIPLVGGYIGIAIPVLFMAVEKGLTRAVILLVWAIIYQQIHDYLLSPRISSRTMTLNAGVALGSALFGGALAGPLGALFAMPVAGMVTAFVKRYVPARPIVVDLDGARRPVGQENPSPAEGSDPPAEQDGNAGTGGGSDQAAGGSADSAR